VPQIGQGKAQSAGNGMPFTKTATQHWSILGRSLRASQEVVIPKAFASLMGQALCVVVLP